MIVNLFSSGALHKVYCEVKNLLSLSLIFRNWREQKSVTKHGVKLNNIFYNKYPQLKLDSQGNQICISCSLCQEVCPTQALEVKKTNLFNFPDGLKFGEAPKHIYLNVDKCIKCTLCVDVCPVDALVRGAKYPVKKVDLVQAKLN